MAADEQRAERIRDLKKAHPGLTWKAIAEHVGVEERSAVEWQKTGGIKYEHAKKLAELFPEVTLDYIWRGEAPDLMGTMNGEMPDDIRAQLAAIDDKLNAILVRLGVEASLPPEARPANTQGTATKATAASSTRAPRSPRAKP